MGSLHQMTEERPERKPVSYEVVHCPVLYDTAVLPCQASSTFMLWRILVSLANSSGKRSTSKRSGHASPIWVTWVNTYFLHIALHNAISGPAHKCQMLVVQPAVSYYTRQAFLPASHMSTAVSADALPLFSLQISATPRQPLSSARTTVLCHTSLSQPGPTKRQTSATL